jgi:chromatin segregation and condensation protein Rec8/ScpA/Scc1 (kleisin family)
MLAENRKILFTDLLKEIKERIILIVTFVALLEMVKRKQLKLDQSQPFSEIWISQE